MSKKHEVFLSDGSQPFECSGQIQDVSLVLGTSPSLFKEKGFILSQVFVNHYMTFLSETPQKIFREMSQLSSVLFDDQTSSG